MKDKLYNPKFGRRGYIQCYYGFGKSKTSASLGQSIRALGHGWKVLLVMFTKGIHPDDLTYYGEVNTIKKRTKKCEFRVEQFGPDNVLYYKNLNDQMRDIIVKGWEFSKKEIQRGFYDLIILDELHIVIDMNLIDINDVIKTFKNKPEYLEIITTGRSKIDEIIEIADLVTEMKAIKHYFNKGIKARKGIEY